MGFLDWLIADPAARDGGFLTRLLDPAASSGMPTPHANASRGSSAPHGFGLADAGLLGGSPLADILRGGLIGWASAAGQQGLAPQLAAGALAASRLARERGQAATREASHRAAAAEPGPADGTPADAASEAAAGDGPTEEEAACPRCRAPRRARAAAAGPASPSRDPRA